MKAMTKTQLHEALKAAGVVFRTKAPKAELQQLLGKSGRAKTKPTTKKIKANKRTRNVVKNGARQPGEGTKCRAVWDAMDGIGDTATAKHARAIAKTHDWNLNNTITEFYQWRKFHGFGASAK